MSSSEFDANVDRAHDLIVVDIVKRGSRGHGIAPRAIGGKAAPVVGTHRRIVAIGSLDIVVVGFRGAARGTSGVIHVDVLVDQALERIVHNLIPRYPDAGYGSHITQLDCMRPLPLALARQVSIVPVALQTNHIAAAIIQDRNRLGAVSIPPIPSYIHPKSYILEITVLHVQQSRVLRIDKQSIRLSFDIGIHANANHIPDRQIISVIGVVNQVIGAGYIRILNHHRLRGGDGYRRRLRVGTFPVTGISAALGDGKWAAPLDVADRAGYNSGCCLSLVARRDACDTRSESRGHPAP